MSTRVFLSLEVGRKSDRVLAGPISAHGHPALKIENSAAFARAFTSRMRGENRPGAFYFHGAGRVKDPWATERSEQRELACPISAFCHPERSEQRERSRRISDSFAPAKPVPILWVGVPGGFYFFTELLTQDT